MKPAMKPDLPLYRRIAATLIDRIATGVLRPGEMLPAEPDLGVEFGASPGTARKAVAELEQRGLVERRQGRGTFVSVRTPESALFHFFRLRDAEGRQVTPELVHETVKRRKARAAEKTVLTGAPDQVFEIDRIRALAGRACMSEVSVVPATLFPGLADRAPLPNALYALYQASYSCAIVRADERLRVGLIGAAGAALGVGAETPALFVERRAIDLSDRVVEFRQSAYLTDRHSYDVSLS